MQEQQQFQCMDLELVKFECEVCGKSCGTKFKCEFCGVFYYCSKKHLEAHWRRLGHKEDCDRMKHQLENFHKLVGEGFNLEFTNYTIRSIYSGEINLCQYLDGLNLHRKYLWKYLCSDLSYKKQLLEEQQQQNQIHNSHNFGIKGSTDNSKSFNYQYIVRVGSAKIINLSSEELFGVELKLDVACMRQQDIAKLCDWKSFYECASVPKSCPVALLLHYSLTIHWSLQMKLKYCGGRIGERVSIIYLGPQAELNLLPSFFLLADLYSWITLEIFFIGPDVGEVFEETKEIQYKNLRMYFVCGTLYDVYSSIKNCLSDFLFVLAPNAGLNVQPSWHESLQLIQEKEFFSVFTDYCEEAIYQSQQLLVHSFGVQMQELQLGLNPFLQPLFLIGKGNNLPCLSNGYALIWNPGLD